MATRTQAPGVVSITEETAFDQCRWTGRLLEHQEACAFDAAIRTIRICHQSLLQVVAQHNIRLIEAIAVVAPWVDLHLKLLQGATGQQSA